jgi:predicted alpha/beta-hydrolase family hydrolase
LTLMPASRSSPLPAEPVRIKLSDQESVSGLLQIPRTVTACYVLGHGAGAGMKHHFMAGVADGLADRGIGTLRFQFPFMERGSKNPDRPEAAHNAIRAAVRTASDLAPRLPLFAGGKSFGGRMTSLAQADAPLPGVVGLIFIGFPLHGIGKPSTLRAAHLSQIGVPMLFLQGSRDALAELPLLVPTIERLRPLATLSVLEHADHSFHVPVRFGRTDLEVMVAMLDVVARWTHMSIEGDL